MGTRENHDAREEEFTPYREEVIAYLRSQDERKTGELWLTATKSPQIEHRPGIVQWLMIIRERSQLSQETLHLAVKILDRRVQLFGAFEMLFQFTFFQVYVVVRH